MSLVDQSIAGLIVRLTSRRKPKMLFHYTSAAGLLGIIQSKTIWSTNIRYLNDTKEYALALEIARAILEMRTKRARSNFERGLIKVMSDSLEPAEGTDIFVSSFSQQGDQLSQWRGYCPSGSGYSIGFKTDVLIKSTEANKLQFLASCVYDEIKQSELIEEVIAEVARFAEEFNTEHPDQHDRLYRESFKLFERLVPLLGPVIKHQSFDEESEWRLISPADSLGPLAPELRPGRSMLVPYIEHRLVSEAERFDLAEIIVGPTPHPELAIKAVEALVAKHSVFVGNIRESEIPYRDW
jgi:hypothetical protein